MGARAAGNEKESVYTIFTLLVALSLICACGRTKKQPLRLLQSGWWVSTSSRANDPGPVPQNFALSTAAQTHFEAYNLLLSAIDCLSDLRREFTHTNFTLGELEQRKWSFRRRDVGVDEWNFMIGRFNSVRKWFWLFKYLACTMRLLQINCIGAHRWLKNIIKKNDLLLDSLQWFNCTINI